MSNHLNEINEFYQLTLKKIYIYFFASHSPYKSWNQKSESLMRKYFKGNDPLVNKYDCNSPLKEISPIEPLT